MDYPNNMPPIWNQQYPRPRMMDPSHQHGYPGRPEQMFNPRVDSIGHYGQYPCDRPNAPVRYDRPGTGMQFEIPANSARFQRPRMVFDRPLGPMGFERPLRPVGFDQAASPVRFHNQSNHITSHVCSTYRPNPSNDSFPVSDTMNYPPQNTQPDSVPTRFPPPNFTTYIPPPVPNQTPPHHVNNSHHQSVLLPFPPPHVGNTNTYNSSPVGQYRDSRSEVVATNYYTRDFHESTEKKNAWEYPSSHETRRKDDLPREVYKTEFVKPYDDDRTRLHQREYSDDFSPSERKDYSDRDSSYRNQKMKEHSPDRSRRRSESRNKRSPPHDRPREQISSTCRTSRGQSSLSSRASREQSSSSCRTSRAHSTCSSRSDRSYKSYSHRSDSPRKKELKRDSSLKPNTERVVGVHKQSSEPKSSRPDMRGSSLCSIRSTNSISRPKSSSIKRTSTSSTRVKKSQLGSSRSTVPRESTGKKVRDHVSKESILRDSTDNKNSERDSLLEKYRKDYCASSNDIQIKLEELSKMKPEEIIEQEKKVWTRTSPSELYYSRDDNSRKVIRATPKLLALCERFRSELVERAEKIRATRPKFELPPRKNRARYAKHKSQMCHSSSSDSDENSSTDEEDCTMEELERKRLHPHRLHEELWFNDSGEMNDGPLCRCSAKARRCGIRHGIYAGEHHLLKCDINTNNGDKLYHYRITISPPTNFLTKTPTMIHHDEHEFIFEGFSMFSHFPLVKLPTCKVIRFNIEYTILYIEEKLPDNFTIHELDLFQDYLFREILELIDLDFRAYGDASGCSQFHFMPRFVRDLPDNGKEILSMNEVLVYLLNNSTELIVESQLEELLNMTQYKWQNFADEIKGMVVTYPAMKPCSVRVDQLDRNQDVKKKDDVEWPEIVHFGIRPPQLSYAGNPEYQKAWREYVKFRHLVANMSKPSFEDKRKLEAKENKLQEMRTQSKMKRDVTVAVSSKGFHRTGIMCDMVQHAMLIPVLVCHLRFHRSCDVLEETIGYRFENRFLLQLALTHPSYRENFGTNPDHARNSLTNCGIRQPEYGDRRIHYMNTRKRGINTLINIMSRFGKRTETESNITHNERLEFLGDAVVEFLTSIHLFHMFPDLEEGGLATYRAAIVQNQHLAVLAKRLNLEEFMLYAHGSDLCHDLELRHAMANCFEALMGALFLDGSIDVADKVFGETLYKVENELLDVWVDYPPHPLQEQEPLGDRKWIPSFELLQKLTKFEASIGVEFKHIRLLARAFTDRSIGYTNLTLGSNQRLEFLGDTVLQLIASEYLYKFFPEHHEGHLSLLRSSLVNNRTQAVVCDDLGMTSYALYSNPKAELKTKDRADLLEAFLGALYVDKDLDYCHVFCHVCFFPRLQDFIMNQDWNDPKSKLQQCCLTLRTMDGGEPDIPIYKVIECKGPTNTRVYTVAVYFRGRRLAAASGHSIQQAEMNAAKEALELSQRLFPQLDHQKRVIAKSMKKQKWPNRNILRNRTSRPPIEPERKRASEDC